MNKRVILAFILIGVILFSPIIAVAQSYKYLSTEMQQNIVALGDTPVRSIPMPVLFGPGCKDISQNFGDARLRHSHEGQDIMAPKGTPVVSPTQAVVLGVEYGSVSGKMVYTANPGGETFYYIHLDRYAEGIAKGQVLQPGDLIGYVGNTGDAISTAPHLHFQINNKLDIPQDPFLRLNADFTNTQKISFLNAILAKTTDPDSLITFLKKSFPKTCTPDFIYSLTVPTTVVAKSAPAETSVLGASTTTASVPTTKEILGINSTGAEVVALQNYLISANAGSNARILKNYGVTGKFGALTKAALIEWQKANNILPATGYYGAKSQAFVATHSAEAQKTTVAKATTPTASASKKLSINRELYEGVSGEDVRALQKFLNANGYIIAETGKGSPGHETGLFGLKTKEAVRKFQIAKNITPAEGNVGPKTVKALLEL